MRKEEEEEQQGEKEEKGFTVIAKSHEKSKIRLPSIQILGNSANFHSSYKKRIVFITNYFKTTEQNIIFFSYFKSGFSPYKLALLFTAFKSDLLDLPEVEPHVGFCLHDDIF